MSDPISLTLDAENKDRDDLSMLSFDADLEVARKLLRAQITSLHRALLATHGRGVLRLPEELFCAVFKCLASENAPSAPSKSSKWIKATRVCRHWRCVALSNPTLWTSLDFGLGRWWANVILARSQAVQLDVRLAVVPGEEYADYHVRNNMQRITSLCVLVPEVLPDTDLVRDSADHCLSPPGRLEDLFSGPAPLLSSFSLVHDPRPIGGQIYTVPGTFLRSTNSPRLQRLTLSRSQPGLGTCYSLTDVYLSGLSSRFIPSLFKLLPQLDHLTRLAIDFDPSSCTPDGRAYWVTNLARDDVCLPLVERFDLDGEDPECSAFLSQLVMPRLSSFRLACFVTSSDPDEHRSMTDLLQDFVGESSLAIRDHASFLGWVYAEDSEPYYDPEDAKYTCCYTVSSLPSWDSPDLGSVPDNAPGISVELSWGDDAIPPLFERAAELCHAMHLGDVRTLYLHLKDRWSAFEEQAMHSMPALLQQLESLDRLAIDHFAKTGFYDKLLEANYLVEYGDPVVATTYWEVVRSELPEAPSDEGTDDTLSD